MAKLLSGTRIYGTANVDTSVTVGSLVAVNTSGFAITGNSTTAPTVALVGANLVIGNSSITGLPQIIVANSTGNTVVNTTSYVISNASAVTYTANTTGLYHTGTVNATSVNAASHTVGTSFVANATGVYHTSTVNAATYTTGSGYGVVAGGVTINATHIAVGNTSVNAFMNSSTLYISGNNIANSTGANNAFNIGGVPAANVVLNYSNQTIGGVKTFSSNLSIGSAVVANGSTGGSGQVLTSNGSGVYWSSVSGGGGGGGGASVTVSGTSPSAPNIGDLWFNTVDGNLKIYYLSNGYYSWVDTSLAGNPTYNVTQNKQAIAFSLVFGGF